MSKLSSDNTSVTKLQQNFHFDSSKFKSNADRTNTPENFHNNKCISDGESFICNSSNFSSAGNIKNKNFNISTAFNVLSQSSPSPSALLSSTEISSLTPSPQPPQPQPQIIQSSSSSSSQPPAKLNIINTEKIITNKNLNQSIMNHQQQLQQHQHQQQQQHSIKSQQYSEQKSQKFHSTSTSTSTSRSSSLASTASTLQSKIAATSKTELKAHALQRDLNEMKNSMSEISDLALGGSATGNGNNISNKEQQNSVNAVAAAAAAIEQHQKKLLMHSSFEKLIDNEETSATNTPEPLVTFPPDDENNDSCGSGGLATAASDCKSPPIIKTVPNWQQQINSANAAKNQQLLTGKSQNFSHGIGSGGSSGGNNSISSNSSNSSSSSTLNFEKRYRKESKTHIISQHEGSYERGIRNSSGFGTGTGSTATTTALKSTTNELKAIQCNNELESTIPSRNKFAINEIRGAGVIQQQQQHQQQHTSSLSSSAALAASAAVAEAASLQQSSTASLSSSTTQHRQQQQHLAAASSQMHHATTTNHQQSSSTFHHHRSISSSQQASSQQKQTFTATGSSSLGMKHIAAATASTTSSSTSAAQSTNFSKITSTSAAGNMIMYQSSINQQLTNENLLQITNLDDLGNLCSNSSPIEIDAAIKKYSNQLDVFVKKLQECDSEQMKVPTLNNIIEIIQRAWTVPTFGHKLGYSLCNALRHSGGLDLLMKNCVEADQDVKFSSARLLEQCLTVENRSHVVDNGLEKVVNIACVCTRNSKTDHSRIGTGILEHLFKHSEGTCSDVIRLGGLDAVLFECRRNDTETLRHCAGALANLSLYGGAENQEAMISKKVPMWLFPLAFHDDDTVKYYACLAIAALVANKEIEAEVLKSGTLDLVEPFVTTHNPSEFAKSNLSYAHGQSKHWLQRLVPVLNSNREEARSLAAFHFCMEAGIKKEQGCTEIFHEIGAIESLKTVASCPNAIASKFAAQALRLIGEQVPHKLSQQVPLWSVEDVQEWVKQIGFEEYAKNFSESLVDGDLLLQLNENNLCEDIGIINGIKRKRFLRELQNLMKMADYSSKDAAKIHNFLIGIGPEYCTYTYAMLNAGVDRETLKHLTDDQLIVECNITNSIHRFRILNALKSQENSIVNQSEDHLEKTLDVFVSYRRSNGSQLASLLKVHLQLRGFSVFIDVERLEAGKFDNNLLNSIRQAKHFILVLTPQALERCIEDYECKDWVHREIVAALNSNCNIIPIIDNFQWPEPEQLPEDMRSVCHFNGVRWIHDYQDACVDKLERFMRGELSNRIITQTASSGGGSSGGTGGGGSGGGNSNNGSSMQYCGDVTPNSCNNTPNTASATRTHPPNYQRMHSNDSGND